MAVRGCVSPCRDGSVSTVSARELLSPGGVAPSSPEKLRSPKKAAEFSALMDSSVELRQALLRSPKQEVRRMVSTGDMPSNTASRSPIACMSDSVSSPLRPQHRGCSPSSPNAGTGGDKLRLLGGGGEIGKRGHASSGIPWRQIPGSVHGGSLLLETGGALGLQEPKGLVQAKMVSQCSPKLGGSRGMRDILCPGDESDKVRSPMAADRADASSEKAFAKDDTPMKQLFPQSLDAEGRDLEHGLHFSYKQQKKGVAQELNTKDSCPFAREDATLDSQRAPSPRRVNKTPEGHLTGTGASPKHTPSSPKNAEFRAAETSIEARRDWKYLQGKPELERLAAEVPILRNSLSSLRAASPLHSQPPAGGRAAGGPPQAQPKRWK